MKKAISFLFVTFLCLTAFSQGAVVTSGTIACGNSNSNFTFSIGQTFNQHSPAANIPAVAEGIVQGYTTVAYDTLLLLSDEMAGNVPGDTVLQTSSAEGYDEELHRQIYEMICTNDTVLAMTSSGQPTRTATLAEPQILPIGSVAPAGPVQLLLDRANPYDYPVGDTTQVTWTASVAGSSKQCTPNVIVPYYNCISSVSDREANSYPVVRIGYYCWTGTNMRATTYGNGSSIPNLMTYPTTDIANVTETLGYLYTWNAASQYNIVGTRMQGVCPDGWHLPNLAEAEYLLAAFDGSDLLSNDSQIRWLPENGTNGTGFSFLPAGFYNAATNSYEGLYVNAYFWTSESSSSTLYHACEFGSGCGTIETIPSERSNGYSIRCVLNY